jgi:hypothetical protein
MAPYQLVVFQNHVNQLPELGEPAARSIGGPGRFGF